MDSRGLERLCISSWMINYICLVTNTVIQRLVVVLSQEIIGGYI